MLPYDYEGQYGHTKHSDYRYLELLERDYTFRHFPQSHFDVAKEVLACRTKVCAWWLCVPHPRLYSHVALLLDGSPTRLSCLINLRLASSSSLDQTPKRRLTGCAPTSELPT